MKIRMLATQCGPEGPIEAGAEVDVEPVWGRDMINGGHAVEVTAAVPTDETNPGPSAPALPPEVQG